MEEDKRFSVNTEYSFSDNSPSSEMQTLLHKSLQGHGSLADKKSMDGMESLNYEIADNSPWRGWYQGLAPEKIIEKVVTKWMIHLLLGILIGMVVVVIKQLVELLGDWKYNAIQSYLRTQDNMIIPFFIYYSINLLYIFISWIVVYFCGPMAGGSGIPEMKGYLNGVQVKSSINLKTFFGKIISIIFSYSSCLALGPEGPMVHIGSMIGGGLGAAKSRTLGFRVLRMFKTLRNDFDQRDFIVSGAASGISAAFGAPIGGVLFVLEEAATFWSRELTWRTFFACMISAFTTYILLNRSEISRDIVNDAGLVTFGASRNSLFRLSELFPFCLLGVLGGILGALFVKLNVRIMKWRRDIYGQRQFLRVFELLAILTITTAVTFWLPLLVDCRPVTDIHFSTETNAVCDNEHVSTSPIYCNKETHFNELGNLFMVPEEKALKLIFSRTSGLFTTIPLIIYFCVYFILVLVTAGLPVAGGLFVPMILLGGTLGRLIGQLLTALFPNVQPPIDESIYGLIGAAAMMTGFSRITISLCVILIEITENIQYLLPIMMAVMFSKWVGDALSHALYDELMELKSIPFLEPHPPKYMLSQGVKDVMARNVHCIKEMEQVSTIIDLLKNTKHNGFPVVSNDSDLPKTYRGFIIRKHLLILLHKKLYYGLQDSLPGILDFEYLSELSSQKELPLDKVTKEIPLHVQDKLLLDVRPYMDRSHIVVLSSFSFIKAYDLFRIHGLRHLPVLEDKMQVVGMLTRHDLLKFHFK